MLAHNGSLLINARDPERVLAAIPQARLTTLRGQSIVVCKHTDEHSIILRQLGFDPPLQTTTDWDFTGNFKPYAHQKKTWRFLLDNNRCFVLNDMGTGKTSAALWAAEYLMQQQAVKNILVVCPLSAISVWVDEVFSVVPHRAAVVLHDNKAKRLALLSTTKSNIYCINHDGVSVISKELKEKKFDLIIVDEASAYRNASTRRYKIFRDLAKAVPRLWLMTATPTPTAPTDAWALIRLVNPASYSASFRAFKELTMRQISNFVWIPRQESSKIVSQFMQPAIRFTKEECLDLPPLVYSNRECELTTSQKKAFAQMKKDMVIEREQGQKTITAANAAVKLIKLIQICAGVVKDNDGIRHNLDDSNRLSTLLECIQEAGNKAIVFVPFKAAMDNVHNFLVSSGFSAELVNGDTSLKERGRIFASFQKGDLQVLVAHYRTAAHSLTLTASSCIIWYSPILSAEGYQQANSRIHRHGQKSSCTVVHIGSCPLEWRLYQALAGKIRMQDAILQQYEEMTR